VWTQGAHTPSYVKRRILHRSLRLAVIRKNCPSSEVPLNLPFYIGKHISNVHGLRSTVTQQDKTTAVQECNEGIINTNQYKKKRNKENNVQCCHRGKRDSSPGKN